MTTLLNHIAESVLFAPKDAAVIDAAFAVHAGLLLYFKHKKSNAEHQSGKGLRNSVGDERVCYQGNPGRNGIDYGGRREVAQSIRE